jgi:hypothetical protein
MDTKYWNVLRTITYKPEWYSKVFDETIVNKWKEELTSSGVSDTTFGLCVRFLKATAQGSRHNKDCKWQDSSMVCKDCEKEIQRKIFEDREDYGVDESVTFPEEIDIYDMIDDFPEECDHPICDCIPPDHELNKYVLVDSNTLSSDLHGRLNLVVDEMMEKEPIDWHPGSNEQVRDLIHPSMYCLDKGEGVDESQRYQWLPAEFHIDESGTVTFLSNSYVNNLDVFKYPSMMRLLEKSFQSCVPNLEKVCHTSLRGKQVQVIIKVGATILKPDTQYPGGSWHIEGMPYEHIIGTALHYLKMENVENSFLEFRKPVIINDEDIDYPQNADKHTTHHYGITPNSHYDGEMNRYLGLIKSQEAHTVFFPNHIQHRVTEWKSQETSPGATRTILAFFLVDPDARIPSTIDTPPQQDTMPHEVALHNRERLMFHRKYFVDQLNKKVFERSYSLCEH